MIDIMLGDAYLLMGAVEDNSVDLILTDPIYDDLDQYAWLAGSARRVLKQNRSLLAFGADAYLPDYFRVMSDHLSWAQMLHWQRYGHIAPGRSGITVITQCMWWEKGRAKPHNRIANWYGACNRGKAARTHDWGKPEDLIIKWMEAFSLPGDLVIDPFCGSGSGSLRCQAHGPPLPCL